MLTFLLGYSVLLNKNKCLRIEKQILSFPSFSVYAQNMQVAA